MPRDGRRGQALGRASCNHGKTQSTSGRDLIVWIRSLGAVLALALVVATPLAAWAFVFQNGETVTTGEGLSDDLYAAGQTVTVTGRIDGDVAAAGRVVAITGTVTGGILAAGQDVRIAGPVGRTVRQWGSPWP